MNQSASQHTASPARLWKRILLLLVLCGLAGLAAVIAMAFAGTLLAVQAITEIPDDVLADAVRQSVEVTLRDGSRQQRLELLADLRDAGPDAKLFVPVLLNSADDPDPEVRRAATEALRQIDPGAMPAPYAPPGKTE